MEKDTNTSKQSFISRVDLEKLLVYLGLLVSFTTLMVYIADIKERTRALEIQYGHDSRLKAVEKQLEEKVK